MQQLYQKQVLELDSIDSLIKWIFKNLYRLLGSLLVIYAVVQAQSASVFMKHFQYYSVLNSRETFWKTILLTHSVIKNSDWSTLMMI